MNNIRFNHRLNFRSCSSVYKQDTEVVERTAVHHHILRKNKVLDGVSSTTGIWDASQGDVPEVFDYHVDRFDLADSLLRRGESFNNATKVAQNAHTSTTESVEN